MDPVQPPHSLWQRILVLTPLGRDAEVLCRLLADNAIAAVPCGSACELIAKMEAGFAALLIGEESLTSSAVCSLQRAIAQQPAWSDPQLILLATGERLSGGSCAIAKLRQQANVVVLERPARALTLVTTVHAALRARRRQYEVRDLMEQEQAARRQAEAATRLKDEFLATVSHEMRNPLNAIVLWAQLLQSGRLRQAEVCNAIEAIQRSAEAQSQLIEDLLDTSRMVFGKLQLELQPCEWIPLLLAAIEMLRPSAQVKHQQLQTMMDPDLQQGMVDPQRLQQVICNLLSNAIKFTPEYGRIEVIARKVKDRVVIQVQDTGMGMNAEFLPHVFDRFRQSDVGTARLVGGLGLGMAITQRLVELHGGTIRADSAGEGRGATFTIDLPLVPAVGEATRCAPSSREHPHAQPVDSLAGVRVLVVEDEPDTRAAMTYMLEKAGADVTAVGSAAAAMAALQTPRNGRGQDVLLSDLGMPGEDGYMLLAQLRALESGLPSDRLPAIAVTAYTQDADRARVKDAGFDAMLDKPIQLRSLLSTIASLAKPRN